MPYKARKMREERSADAAAFAFAFINDVKKYMWPGPYSPERMAEHEASLRVAGQNVDTRRLRQMDALARKVSKPPSFILEMLRIAPPPYERVVALCAVWSHYVPTKRPFAKYATGGAGTLTDSDFVVWAKPYMHGITPYQIRKGVDGWRRAKR